MPRLPTVLFDISLIVLSIYLSKSDFSSFRSNINIISLLVNAFGLLIYLFSTSSSTTRSRDARIESKFSKAGCFIISKQHIHYLIKVYLLINLTSTIFIFVALFLHGASVTKQDYNDRILMTGIWMKQFRVHYIYLPFFRHQLWIQLMKLERDHLNYISTW